MHQFFRGGVRGDFFAVSRGHSLFVCDPELRAATVQLCDANAP